MSGNIPCKQMMALLCILLLLCSPLGILLSHGHECVGEDCQICGMIGASKGIFALLMICITLAPQEKCIRKGFGSEDGDIYRKDKTLVLQKVKLTD